MLICAYAPRVYELWIRIYREQSWMTSSAGKVRRLHLESYIGALFGNWTSNHIFTKASKIHTSCNRSLFFLQHFMAYQLAFREEKTIKKYKREVHI